MKVILTSGDWQSACVKMLSLADFGFIEHMIRVLSFLSPGRTYKLSFFVIFDQEFFVQAMWVAPLCQTFLHLLYDKEILEEPIILQWYSRKHAGGEDSGFEQQRKQLRQQVRHSWHVTRYVSMSLHYIDSEIGILCLLVTGFLVRPSAVYVQSLRYYSYFVSLNRTLCSEISKF